MFGVFGGRRADDAAATAKAAPTASPYNPLPKAKAAAARRRPVTDAQMGMLSAQVAELDQVGWLPGATRGLARSAHMRVPVDAMPFAALLAEPIPTTQLNVVSSDIIARNSDERSKGNLAYTVVSPCKGPNLPAEALRLHGCHAWHG